MKNDAQPGIKQTSTVTTLDDTNLVLQQQADIASDPTAPFTFDYTVTITMKRL